MGSGILWDNLSDVTLLWMGEQINPPWLQRFCILLTSLQTTEILQNRFCKVKTWLNPFQVPVQFVQIIEGYLQVCYEGAFTKAGLL